MALSRKTISFLSFILLLMSFQLLSYGIVALNAQDANKELKPLKVIENKNYSYFYNPIDGEVGFHMYLILKKDHDPLLKPDVGKVSIFKYQDRSHLSDIINDLEHDNDLLISNFSNGACRSKKYLEESYFLINFDNVYFTLFGSLVDIKSTLDIAHLCGFNEEFENQ